MSDWHYDLALQRELEAAEEAVTGWVMEELDLFKDDVPIGDGVEREEADLPSHQLTQLLAVARESESVPAVTSYLRYQVGRAGEGKGLRYEDIGMQIVSLLESSVYTEATNAANRAAEHVRGRHATATEEEKRRAWIRLTRLFLAVLRRRLMQRSNDLTYQQSPRKVVVP